MNYRFDKYGNKLSCLGFGCMRLKNTLGVIDYSKAEEQILEAYNSGVNYFDTAYIYPGSESVLGEILYKNNIRDKVNIATKLPHYLIKSNADLDKIFNEELKRLKTDHVDYYLIHMLTNVEAWQRLIELGILEWIEKKKQKGQIRQIGFSYHGGTDAFIQLVDAFEWEFCMIQYNYMDENSQAGKRGLKYANSKGLPVMIMEPLRGGRLVNNLPETSLHLFKSYKKSFTPAQWSFKWLYNQPEVTVVLSGMNSIEMIRDNVNTASCSNINDLSSEDEEMLKSVVEAINARVKVACTGCGYCMPCPKGVDIPGCFSAYNRYYTDSKFGGLKDYFMCTALRKNSTAASNCIKCGKCEKHCPQGIKIRDELQSVNNELEGALYKAGKNLAKLFRF